MLAFWLFVHRWFGLTVGLFFVLQGLTGSYMVFLGPLQERLEAGVRRSSGTEGAIDLGRALTVAQAERNGAKPIAIRAFEDPMRNLEFTFTGVAGRGRQFGTVFVDPVTNAVRGREVFSDTLGGMIFYWHHDLFLGKPGKIVLGLAGITVLVLLLTGLYLWWPRRVPWRRALKLGRMTNAFQTHFELHRFAGFYTLALTLMVTFSGVYIARPGWFQNDNRPPERKTDDVDIRRIVGLMQNLPRPVEAVLILREGLVSITSPGRTQTFDWRTLEPREAVGVRDMHALQATLHFGDFWGAVGSGLIFVAGLLPLFFYISGFYIWWTRRRLRKGLHHA